jgi:hypothetical protein
MLPLVPSQPCFSRCRLGFQAPLVISFDLPNLGEPFAHGTQYPDRKSWSLAVFVPAYAPHTAYPFFPCLTHNDVREWQLMMGIV